MNLHFILLSGTQIRLLRENKKTTTATAAATTT
jgi:hypothetical protein